MTDFPRPTAQQLAAIRAEMGLSVEEFGTMLGFKDASRVVRALEQGEWHGKPYKLTGSAVAALTYFRAMVAVVAAYNIDPPHGQQLLKAVDAAEALIPERLRKC